MNCKKWVSQTRHSFNLFAILSSTNAGRSVVQNVHAETDIAGNETRSVSNTEYECFALVGSGFVANLYVAESSKHVRGRARLRRTPNYDGRRVVAETLLCRELSPLALCAPLF